MNEVIAKRLALNMALMCVRNTCIEDIHASVEPSSKAGDFSHAKLVTPYGEIPWNKLSRIRNDEMREFMKQVVDRLRLSCHSDCRPVRLDLTAMALLRGGSGEQPGSSSGDVAASRSILSRSAPSVSTGYIRHRSYTHDEARRDQPRHRQYRSRTPGPVRIGGRGTAVLCGAPPRDP
jgi:hypothetical protein